ncbi:ABC transporter ATP-binding protein [Paeniglutamicibacter sp. R2-26]|uniref:ABC transporter ATP-binding protein n=1 Tax=Paeniglutamicibacter sp. R2-26 TaxID=3144417 RepID=UPI003EE71E98
MLIANSLAIAGRHQPLLEPTSLAAARGQLLLVQAEPQPTRTALALGLSARMRPSSGTVAWSGNAALRAVRRISALVDSPEINEPEAHLKVRDLVAEDLALQPGPVWRRSSIDSWMERHKMDHLADEWLDVIDPLDRLALLTHLALEDHRVELAVFDSPDRHGMAEEAWIDYLQTVAGGRRAPAVVAIVTRIPGWWEGPIAYAGTEQQQSAVDEAVVEATEPATDAEPSDTELTAGGEAAPADAPAQDPGPAPETTVLPPVSEENR